MLGFNVTRDTTDAVFKACRSTLISALTLGVHHNLQSRMLAEAFELPRTTSEGPLQTVQRMVAALKERKLAATFVCASPEFLRTLDSTCSLKRIEWIDALKGKDIKDRNNTVMVGASETGDKSPTALTLSIHANDSVTYDQHTHTAKVNRYQTVKAIVTRKDAFVMVRVGSQGDKLAMPMGKLTLSDGVSQIQ